MFGHKEPRVLIVIENLTINTYYEIPRQDPPPSGDPGDMEDIREGIHTMSDQLTRLTTEVAESATVTESAIALLGSLSSQIRELSTDPQALTELADKLDAQQASLANAIAANTTAADENPQPVEEPAPEEGSAEGGTTSGEGEPAEV